MHSPQWASSINSSLSKERNTWKNETNETRQRSVHVPLSIGRPWAGNPPPRNRPHASNSPCQTFSYSAYAQLLAWQAAGTDYLHLLVAEGGEVVGRVNLTEVADGTAELGYRIAQKAAGQGLATAAVRKVRELAATEYGLTRLRARVTLNNPASRKVLEHNGFVAVGELTLNGKPAMSYICELR